MRVFIPEVSSPPSRAVHRDVDGYLDPTQFPRYRVTYDIEAKRSDPKEEEKA